MLPGVPSASLSAVLPDNTSGLVALMRSAPDITVVAEAADGPAALEVARAHRPDVVLTDVRMPGATGIEITPRLRETGASVLVISGFDLDEFVLGALAAGADGYLVKSEDPQRILAAVRDVHRGDAVIAPSATRRPRSAPTWRPWRSAPTPAARSASPRPSPASWASSRPTAAARAGGSLRSRPRSIRPGRSRARCATPRL